MDNQEKPVWAQTPAGTILWERDQARAEVTRLEGVVIRLAHEKDEAIQRYAVLEDEVLSLSRHLADLRGARLSPDRTCHQKEEQ